MHITEKKTLILSKNQFLAYPPPYLSTQSCSLAALIATVTCMQLLAACMVIAISNVHEAPAIYGISTLGLLIVKVILSNQKLLQNGFRDFPNGQNFCFTHHL